MRSAILKELDKNGVTVCTTKGDSMEPLLANRRDIVTIRKTKLGERLKKYDVPLYMRDGGSNYVLHRIIRVRKEDYVICGDNRWRPEYGITDRNIVGVMTGIIRDGKELPLKGLKYRLYVRLWCKAFPIRALFLLLKDIPKLIRRRIK